MGVTRPRRVEWGETDAAGIVFYPNYFRWFDSNTHELLADLGYPVTRMLREGFAVPIVEARSRFLVPLVYDDHLLVHSRVAEVRTRAFRVAHSVTRAGVPVCEGWEVRMWVAMRPEERALHAEPLPAELRERLVRDDGASHPEG